MSFRLLHTADWQIGKPFGNVPGDAGADLRRQRIATVRKLAEYAAAQQLDAVLVAGDAFDSNEVEDRTIHQMLSALSPFDGPWVFLPGNHDAALVHSVWSRLRQLPQGTPDVFEPTSLREALVPPVVELQGHNARICPSVDPFLGFANDFFSLGFRSSGVLWVGMYEGHDCSA